MPWCRRARPARSSWNLAKTAGQIVVFWGAFLFLIPPALVALAARLGFPPGPTAAGRLVASVLFIGASALGLASAMTMAVRGRGTPLPFDSARVLVVTGPYAWVRNPMALAGLAQGAAVALWHGSVLVGIYVIAGGLFWHVVVRPLEEADLAHTFGDAFECYRSRVPLWWPRRPSHARNGTP
jgi:protein-S-isoprenylcysteine O-methyltransferase Ste14